ncbi:MAG: DUF3866 family protein [Clostridia bacterium]|nr:DUF3866 family protein [Clostridia bacterium]
MRGAFRAAWAEVVAVSPRAGRLDLEVRFPDGQAAAAVAYPRLTGAVAAGDRVLLNVTAGDLGLGSGGRHFVLWVDGRPPEAEPGPGHIVKWRYTPWQRAFLHVEEEGAPGHPLLREANDLAGSVVAALSLHSQLLPFALGFTREAGRLGRPLALAYVHTDGGSLPVAWSDTVAKLKAEGLIARVLSVGHAFGGDDECVALPSALLAARLVHGADAVAVGMGPGIVGTGTRLGHTGTEQAWSLQVAAALGGRPLAALRLSGADRRERHFGLSHHALAALSDLAPPSSLVAWPAGRSVAGEPLRRAEAAWRSSPAARRHLSVLVDLDGDWAWLAARAEGWRTMGRGVRDDPLAFAAGAAAGVLGARLAAGGPGLSTTDAS